MKSFIVNGIRVCIFDDGIIRIEAKDKTQADAVMKYLFDEGLFPLDVFKSSR